MGTRSENEFNDMVQQILGMAGEEGKARRKKMEEDSYSGFVNKNAKDATDEYNLMMGRTPELKLEAAKGANTLANTQENNIGLMARQQLGEKYGMELGQQQGEFGIRGHEITAGATRYAADTGKEKIIGGTPEEQTLLNTRAVMHSPWAKDRTPEEVSAMIAKVNTKRVPGTDFVQPDSVTPPAGSNPPVTPPIRTPATTGTASMEFPRTGLGPSREALALAKKKSEDNLLYGTKPQNRSWLSGF